MKLKALAITAAILAGAAFAPQVALAAALPAATAPQSQAAEGGLLQEVRHRRHWHHHHHHHRRFGRCWKWRHICADRWGWGTWRQRRCLWNHGC